MEKVSVSKETGFMTLTPGRRWSPHLFQPGSNPGIGCGCTESGRWDSKM